MNTFLLLILLLNPQQNNFSHFYNDEPCYLNEYEKQKLEVLADRLKSTTGANVIYICRGKKIGDASYHKGRLVVYLDEDPQKRSMQSRQNVFFLTQEFLDQLTIQYIRQGERGDELVNAVSLAFGEIDKLRIYRKQLEEQPVEEEGEQMSPEFWWTIRVYAFLLVIYGIWVAVKWNNKATNKAEFWEHYGYSRFHAGPRYALWMGVFILYVFILNKFIFYYGELFILLIPLAFLMRPSVMLVSGVIAAIIDWKTEIPVETNGTLKPSLGQKCFILDSKTGTAKLILLDIIELIISKTVIITPQIKDGRYGTNRYHNFLSVPDDVKSSGVSAFQHEAIYSLREGKEFRVSDELMEDLITEIGSFKEIRKDFFLKDLVRMGFISKKSWVLNQFKLTPAGLEYQKKLKDWTENMDNALQESVQDTSKLEKVKREVLLVQNYEKKIEDLYTHLVESGIHHRIAETEIGPLLEQSFSFYEFKTAINRQIRKIHRSYMVDEESQKGSLEWAD